MRKKFTVVYLVFLLLSVLIFTGCYEEYEYRVYYHDTGATGGQPPVDLNSYAFGSTIIVLERGSLENNDYTFLGWRELGWSSPIHYTGTYITMQRSDINLHPVWDDGIDTPFIFRVEENNEVTITRYDESSWRVVIPDTLVGKPVTVIGNNAFSNLNISEIILPKQLKHIGIGAFSSNKIAHLIIPHTVETADIGAFRDNNLSRLTLGYGMSTIGPHAFSNNELRDITILENIKLIDTGAFHDNEITMITIGAEVEIVSDSSLGNYGGSFRVYYNKDKRAGVYLYIDDAWERF